MSITVFLVDDHAVVRQGLRLLLEGEEDIEVVGEAAGGADALRLIPPLAPDVAVVDITMPDMNGIEVARQLRQSCPSLRAVILSMHSSPEYVLRALDAGAYAYVTKESAGAELVSAVRSAQQGCRYLSAGVSTRAIEEHISRSHPT